MRTLIWVSMLLLAAACGAPAAETTAADAPSPAAPSDSAATAPAGTSTTPASGERLEGTLGGDAQLEGGCVWLETADGRVEVVWPDGWTASADPVALRGPSGDVVAEAGDTVTIVGAPAGDRMSTCQVGQIWTATAVEVR